MLPAWFVGEFCGTFLLVFFGCGSVCASVTLGALAGNFQVALVWGVGIALAISLTGALSGAHLNPAVTLGMAVWNRFPWKRVLPYMMTQLVAAFVAAAVLYGIFGGAIRSYEQHHQIVRSQPGGEATAMFFGEYYPNPGGQPLTDALRAQTSPVAVFFAEFTGTALLLIAIGGLTDKANSERPTALTAALIGLTITLLIALFGPLSMACFNPARDLGPRIFSSLAGWGSLPFTTNGSGWWAIYIVAPFLGGVFGGGVHAMMMKPAYRAVMKITGTPIHKDLRPKEIRDADVVTR